MSKILLFVPIILAITLFTFFFFNLEVRNIKIDQNQNCLPQAVPPEELNILHKNIFLLSPAKLKADLINKYPCIDQVDIKKRIPSTIEIKIGQKQPVAKIEGTNLAITKDGLVMEHLKVGDLPIFYPPQNLQFQLGQKINDKTIAFTLELIWGLLKSDFTPVSIRIIDQSDVAVYARDNIIVIFSSQREVNSQIDSLQVILAQSKIDATKIAKIDLRFDKPVIVYK